MFFRKPLAVSVAIAAGVLGVSNLCSATPKNALIMGMNIDAITTFDPAQTGERLTNEILTNTCDSLVRFDPSNEAKVIPRFAKSWDVSEDGLTITFHLHNNAVFPSGNRATAHDVAWSLQRVVLAGLANGVSMTEFGFNKETIKNTIVAKDDHTLVMTLDKPYPLNLILQAIAANRVANVLDSKKILENEVNGDYGNKYLTTRTECLGPYKLTVWNASDSITLKTNDNYYGTAPNLKTVVIRHVAEPGTQALLLKKGDIDVARDLAAQNFDEIEKSNNTRIEKVLSPQLMYWMLNVDTNPALANPKVRQALRYIIDYKGLNSTVMKHEGTPRSSFVPLGSFGALDEKAGAPFDFNPEKAKSLLKEAGYENGFEMTLFVGSHALNNLIAENVQQNAKQAGINVKVERMANAQLFSRLRSRDYQSGMVSWVASYPDAHSNASRLAYNPDPRPEAKLTLLPVWRTGWQDNEINRLTDQALLEKDETKRQALYEQMQHRYMSESSLLMMFQTYYIAGVNNELKKWTWNGFSIYYDLASK